MNKEESKRTIFKNLINTNAFWSYNKQKLALNDVSDDMLIENTLIHGDVKDIVLLFDLFTKDVIVAVWKSKLCMENKYEKLNYYLAKIFFDIDDVKSFMNINTNSRYERLKQLAG